MKIRALSKQELGQILDYVSKHKVHSERDRIIILMSVLSGLRISEVASLQVKDILSKYGTIKDEITVKSRKVSIPDLLKSEMEDYLKFYYSTNTLIAITYSIVDCPLIYSQKTIDGWNANTLGNYIYHLLKDANIKNASSLSFRSTFITNVVKGSAGVMEAKRLTGIGLGSIEKHLINLNYIQCDT